MGGFEPTIAANNSGRGTAGPHNLQDFKLWAQHLCCRCSGLLWQISRFGAASAKPGPENAEKGRAPRERPCRQPRELGGASETPAPRSRRHVSTTGPATGRSVRELVATTPRRFVKTTPTASTSASRGARAHCRRGYISATSSWAGGAPEALDEQRLRSFFWQITARRGREPRLRKR